MKFIKEMLPGILVCLIIAVAAKLLSLYVPMIGAVTLAIIVGMLVGNLIKFQDRFNKGIKFSEKKILETAIMLLGFKLQLAIVGKLGIKPLIIVLSIQTLTILTGVFLGKIFKFGKRFSLLMGVGNAVCGSSAIAAVAPVIKAREDETGISIGVVNLMGTIGIFLLPLIAGLLHYTATQGGLFTGGILQAVGQVVAAGFSLGEETGTLATLVKMVRVLMLGPIVLLISFFYKTSDVKRRIQIPPFIIGFVICSILATIFPNDTIFIPHLNIISKWLLMTAMAAIGMKIKFADLLRSGPKAILLGGCIFLVQILFMMLVLSIFY